MLAALLATVVLVVSSLVLQSMHLLPVEDREVLHDEPSPPASARTLLAPVPRPTPMAPAPRPTASAVPVPDGDLAEVVRVVDGDTAKVRVSSGEELTLRLIGVDTPETVHPSQPVGCYGPEASAEAKRLLPVGAKVRLVYDESQGRVDYYGRALVYLHLPGGLDYAEHMIATGFGVEYRYRKDYQRMGTYRAQEAAAREAGRGLWGACER